MIEGDGGLEESAASGPGNFNLGANGGAYLLGTIPKGQTITFADATGQTTLVLGNGTLVNEGTLHLDLPAGDENNTNIEEGSIVNRGTIYGTVEGTNAKNVIDVPLTNEAGAVLAADSGTLFDNREVTNNGSVQIASGSLLELVAVKFVNGAGAMIVPEISGPSTFGRITLGSGATVQAAGTLAPTLTGGYTPSAGAEFDVVEGATVSGTFGTVSGGFHADYSHEAASPSYVGVVYGTASSGPSTPGVSRATPRVTSVASVAGKVVVKLSCPPGASGCASVTVKVTVTEHLKGGRLDRGERQGQEQDEARRDRHQERLAGRRQDDQPQPVAEPHRCAAAQQVPKASGSDHRQRRRQDDPHAEGDHHGSEGETQAQIAPAAPFRNPRRGTGRQRWENLTWSGAGEAGWIR